MSKKNNKTMELDKNEKLNQLEEKLLVAISKGQLKKANNTFFNIVNNLVQDPNDPDWAESMERREHFEDLAEKSLYQAVTYGQLEIVKNIKIWFLQENYECYIMDTYFGEGLSMAARNGHMKIFKLLISWGASYNYDDLLGLIEGHRLDVIKLLLKSEAKMEIDKTPVITANDFKKSVLEALENNQIEVVKFLIMFDPLDMKHTLFFSCRGYRNDRYPRKNYISNIKFKRKISESTWLEIIDIIGKYCGLIPDGLKRKPLNREKSLLDTDIINRALQLVADDNKLTLMKRLKDWGATDFNTAMIWAAEGNHRKAMKLLKRWGATNYGTAKSRSSKYAKLKIISWLRSLNDIIYPSYGDEPSPTRRMSHVMKETANVDNKEWNIAYWECMSCYMQWQPDILNAWKR